MPVLVAPTEKTTKATATRIGKIAAAAFISASLSTLLAGIFRNSIGRMNLHLAFLGAVVAIGLALHWMGSVVDQLDAGLVFVVFLFEPAGRILLHQERAPGWMWLVAPAALVGAYFFGQKHSTGHYHHNVSGE